MSESGKSSKAADRRTFLKIGAGVVAGVAIATVVEVPYYSNLMSGNSSSSSSTVSSLQNQLSSAQDQLISTSAQLSQAQGTVSSLNGQLSATQSQLSGISSELATSQQALSSANSQVSSLQVQVDSVTGFLTLSTTEQSLLGAIALALIPADGNGPSATDAGVIYFIDRQLASDYGKSAHMYMQGPFVQPNLSSAVTVDGITYAGGSTQVTIESGMQYQYHLNFREFFRYGLDAFQAYCNSAYGGNFETLSSADQVAALTDAYNNKPTSFNNIIPQDFFYETFVMVWSGYFMDPIYGGNKGMAAWSFSAFNGLNQGNFYGEGFDTKQLMIATTPTQLRPVSLAQFQKGSP